MKNKTIALRHSCQSITSTQNVFYLLARKIPMMHPTMEEIVLSYCRSYDSLLHIKYQEQKGMKGEK